MEDEVFEKYFERIDCIFDSWFASTTNERKAKLKEILEEVENMGYNKAKNEKWRIYAKNQTKR